jgi:hypothetical protein
MLAALLLILSALLTIWLVWAASRRADRRRVYGRAGASVLAVGALLLTIFPPSISRKINSAEAILLTEGFSEDTLRRLIQEREENPLLFSYQQPAKEAVIVNNVGWWRQENPQIRKVHVLGYGLPGYALPALDSVQVVPHLSPLPEGLTFIDWTRKVKLGETLRLSGRYRTPAQEDVKLVLSLAGLPVDSLILAKGEEPDRSFQLRHQPKQSGRFLYQLSIAQGNSSKKEIVPVEVQTSEPLKVLILSSFPSFEIKFIKNTLSQQQQGVALRTLISKGKFQTEWAHMPETNLSRLSPALLRQFDLLLCDTQSLQALSGTETRALEQAIANEGLGLLVWPDALPLNRNLGLFRDFSPQKISDKDLRPVRVRWGESDQASAPVSALPFAFSSSGVSRSLVSEVDGSILIARQARGWGQVALNLLTDTYRWALEGKSREYEAFWSYLIQKMAKRQTPDQQWELAALPIVHQPLTLQLSALSAPADFSQAQVNRNGSGQPITVSFRQNPLFDERFQTTFWPDSTGWHVVRANQGVPYWFYVFGPEEWKTVQQSGWRETTSAQTTMNTGELIAQTAIYSRKEMPAIWFFLLFLFSSGFLWLEEKL